MSQKWPIEIAPNPLRLQKLPHLRIRLGPKGKLMGPAEGEIVSLPNETVSSTFATYLQQCIT